MNEEECWCIYPFPTNLPPPPPPAPPTPAVKQVMKPGRLNQSIFSNSGDIVGDDNGTDDDVDDDGTDVDDDGQGNGDDRSKLRILYFENLLFQNFIFFDRLSRIPRLWAATFDQKTFRQQIILPKTTSIWTI